MHLHRLFLSLVSNNLDYLTEGTIYLVYKVIRTNAANGWHNVRKTEMHA